MSHRYAVLVTGGRDYDNRNVIGRTVLSFPEGALVIHGGARGADSVVRSACKVHGYPYAEVPYFGWLGKLGGYERNQMMVDLLSSLRDAGWLVKVVAFPGGRGTADCTRRAEEAGLPIQRVTS